MCRNVPIQYDSRWKLSLIRDFSRNFVSPPSRQQSQPSAIPSENKQSFLIEVAYTCNFCRQKTNIYSGSGVLFVNENETETKRKRNENAL